MEIGGIQVSPGHPCPHSTGSGCDDYAHRPGSCVRFNCGWIIDDSPLPDWMQPNRARLIVLFNKSRWFGRPVDLAVPVGRRIPPRALNWLKAFAQRQQRPLLYLENGGDKGRLGTEQQVYAHGPPQFQQGVAERQARGLALW
jgi:hypothetical protein